VLIENNKFVGVGAIDKDEGGDRAHVAIGSRPSISLGESVYAIHIHDNEWHYKVSPHPDTWTFCMPQQYGGSFKRNYVHMDKGLKFPDNASMFQIKGGYPTYTYLDSTYQLYRNTGYMIWEDNRYEVSIGRAYDFFSTGIDKTDRYWMRGALIKDEDWTGSVIVNSAAASIRNGYPAKAEDVVIVENIKGLIGSELSWLAEFPATSFPQLFANMNDPAEIQSITTQSDLQEDLIINDPLVRVDGVMVKIEGKVYKWNEKKEEWISIGIAE
jgi:hypothetical protein